MELTKRHIHAFQFLNVALHEQHNTIYKYNTHYKKDMWECSSKYDCYQILRFGKDVQIKHWKEQWKHDVRILWNALLKVWIKAFSEFILYL